MVIENKLNINFNPTEKDIECIKEWLIEEINITNKGFYNNWNIIYDKYKTKEILVITDNEYPIGFLTYTTFDFCVRIDIFSIKPSERRKGVGKKFINEVFSFFKSKNILVLKLFCSPENSHLFWRKNGFEYYSLYEKDTKRRINMFKPLIKVLKSDTGVKSNLKINLWNCESHLKNKVPYKWSWDIILKDDKRTLVKPILFPIQGDWYMEFIVNDELIFSDKVKRFKENNDYPYTDFLFVTQLQCLI